MPDEQFGSGFWRSFVWWQPVLKKSGSTPLERLILDSRPGRVDPFREPGDDTIGEETGSEDRSKTQSEAKTGTAPQDLD